MSELMIVRCPGCKRAFKQDHQGQRFHSAFCCSGYYTQLRGKGKFVPAYPNFVPAVLAPGEVLIKSQGVVLSERGNKGVAARRKKRSLKGGSI